MEGRSEETLIVLSHCPFLFFLLSLPLPLVPAGSSKHKLHAQESQQCPSHREDSSSFVELLDSVCAVTPLVLMSRSGLEWEVFDSITWWPPKPWKRRWRLVRVSAVVKRHRDCVTVQMEWYPGSWEPNNITKSAQRTRPGVLRTEEQAGFTLSFFGGEGGRSGTFQDGGWSGFKSRDWAFYSVGQGQGIIVRAIRVFWG